MHSMTAQSTLYNHPTCVKCPSHLRGPFQDPVVVAPRLLRRSPVIPHSRCFVDLKVPSDALVSFRYGISPFDPPYTPVPTLRTGSFSAGPRQSAYRLASRACHSSYQAGQKAQTLQSARFWVKFRGAEDGEVRLADTGVDRRCR